MHEAGKVLLLVVALGVTTVRVGLRDVIGGVLRTLWGLFVMAATPLLTALFAALLAWEVLRGRSLSEIVARLEAIREDAEERRTWSTARQAILALEAGLRRG